MRVTVLNMKFLNFSEYIFKALCAIILLFGITVFTVENSLYGSGYIEAVVSESIAKTIIIDAGHGGEDCGAIGSDGVYEKDLNLAFAFSIGELLVKKGYAVVYTRTEDKLLYREEENIRGIRKISDLKNRCKIAAEYPEAIFISIHMNSYSNPKYSGLQVYYSTKNEESAELASHVQNSVRNTLQTTNNRKIKPGKDIYVLENTENISILIECGFLTNPAECKLLEEKEYQKSLSFSIVCGIIEYDNKNLAK